MRIFTRFLIFIHVLLPSSAMSDDAPLSIFFIGASWCPFCERAMPEVAEFGTQFGVPVLALSPDGKDIAGFETEQADIGSWTTEIKEFPTLIFYDPNRQMALVSIVGYQEGTYSEQLETTYEFVLQAQRMDSILSQGRQR